MKVMVLGSGGREHALAWKLNQDKKVNKIYVVPGNGGTGEIAENVDIDLDDFSALLNFAQKEEVDLTIVGPEKPLVNGIVDVFAEAGLNIFGPGKAAAKLEGSKIFAKEIMTSSGVPTAGYTTAGTVNSALEMVDNVNYPVVIKADGLAAGKGVYISHTEEEAKEAITELMVEKKFGRAGERVIFEDFLPGRELSLLALVDDKTVKPLLPARDYKKAKEGGKGPNTGGMGAYAPDRTMDRARTEAYLKHLVEPVISELKRRGTAYQGLLYCGLIITEEGPKVLEYNARFGDPETQVVLPLLENDLVDVFAAVNSNQLDKLELSWSDSSAVTTVAASGGYPADYTTGQRIEGLDKLKSDREVIVFQAGTIKSGGRLLTDGGRVLAVTGLAEDIEAARRKSLEALKNIRFENMYYREDIAKTGGDNYEKDCNNNG